MGKKTSVHKSFLLLATVLRLLMVCVGFPIQAQWLTGIKSGISVAKGTVDVRNIAYAEPDNLVGFSGGLMSQMYLSPFWALQVEFLYTQRGHKVIKYYDAERFANKDPEFMSTWQMRMHTLELPLHLLYVAENDQWKFCPEIGITPSYWVSASQKADLFINNLGSTTLQHKTFKDTYAFDTEYITDGKIDRRWLLFSTIGAQIAFKTRWFDTGLVARYYIPLNDRYAYQNKQTYDQTYWARTWTVSLQCLIPIIKKVKSENENPDDEVY